MEHFLHFGDIVVRLMDIAKKTTYHHAKNVGSSVYTKLFLVSNEPDFLLTCEGTENIDAQSHVSQPCNGTKCVSWDVLHPSFTFCAPTNYPINFDQRHCAPLPPHGRELNLPTQGTQ